MTFDETAHGVFICYSTKDRAIAFEVCEKLEAAGIRCWIAPRDITPTRPWGGEIVLAIKRSTVMLLIFTTYANESKDVRNEVVLASDFNCAILTYRHEEIVPCDELLYYLRSIQWFDAFASIGANRFESLVSWFKRILATSDQVRIAAQAAAKLAQLEADHSDVAAAPTSSRAVPTVKEELPATASRPAAGSPNDAGSERGGKKADTSPAHATLLEGSLHVPVEPLNKSAGASVPILANKDFLGTVSKKLAAYIGPIASDIVDEAASRAHTETEFYELCTQELRPKERERFLDSLKRS